MANADKMKSTTDLANEAVKDFKSNPEDIPKIKDAITKEPDKVTENLNKNLTTAIDDCSDPVVVNSIKGVIEESKKPATEEANKTPLIEAPKKTETVAPVFTKEFKGTNTGTTKEAYNDKSPQLEQAKLLIADS